jgi:hypothetical protein
LFAGIQYASSLVGGGDVDKAKIRFLLSILMDSGMYLSLPVSERLMLLSRLAKSYPSLFPVEEDKEDEDSQIGYESSWSEIFRPVEEIIDRNRR